MSPDDIVALEIGRLFLSNVRLSVALEQLKAELEKATAKKNKVK